VSPRVIARVLRPMHCEQPIRQLVLVGPFSFTELSSTLAITMQSLDYLLKGTNRTEYLNYYNLGDHTVA